MNKANSDSHIEDQVKALISEIEAWTKRVEIPNPESRLPYQKDCLSTQIDEIKGLLISLNSKLEHLEKC